MIVAPPRAACLAAGPVVAAAPDARLALSARALLLLGAGCLVVPALVDAARSGCMARWNAVVLAHGLIDCGRLARPAAISRHARVDIAADARRSRACGSRSRTRPLRRSRAARGLSRRTRCGANWQRSALTVDRPRVRLRPTTTVHARGTRGDTPVGDVAARGEAPGASRSAGARAALRRPCASIRISPRRRQAMFLIRSRQVAIEKRRARVAGSAATSRACASTSRGDEQRDICWTATARRGKLGDAGLSAGAQPDGLDPGGRRRLLRARTTDGRCWTRGDAALALAQVALGAGDRVGAHGLRPRHAASPRPARGVRHLRAIVDALATVHAERRRGGPCRRRGDGAVAAEAARADRVADRCRRDRRRARSDRERARHGAAARRALRGHAAAGAAALAAAVPDRRRTCIACWRRRKRWSAARLLRGLRNSAARWSWRRAGGSCRAAIVTATSRSRSED